MAFSLEQVVPWGRAFDEYCRMFALTNSDLDKRILGCADGPASFNARLTARGGSVISCDPLYAFSREEIRRRIDETTPRMIEQARENADSFLWSNRIPDPDALGRHRSETMCEFLADYDLGREQGRYLAAQLPDLPFPAGAFDLGVCSHFLFLYSEQLSAAFHVDSVLSLLRVADEVRLFPLLNLAGQPSCHLEPVAGAVQSAGYRLAIETVAYEFQRGGNQIMRIGR